MSKRENLCFFNNHRSRKNRRYTGKEKGEILKRSRPFFAKGRTIREVASLMGVPYNTYYSWIQKLKKEGKDALEDQCLVRSQESIEEYRMVIEWMNNYDIKKNPSGFKKAKRRLKFKRSALTYYIRYRASVRNAKKEIFKS